MFFLVSDKTNAFAPREQAILERLATQIAPAVNNAQQFQKMQQLVLALESIGDGVIFLNINGDIQFINRAFADIFAYELDELRGRNISFIARGQEKEVLDRSQEFPTWEGEVGRTRKDGEHIDLYLTLTPVRDQYGRLIGNIGVCKDITETKRTEQRIKETARLSSIGELAAGVAHEINNPLTSVLGFSELILARNPPQDIRKDLEAVFSEANRAAKIVHNLLSFARKGELSMSYMDLPSVLDRALEIKAYEFLVNNINVVRDYAIELPHTLLDEQQIIQIVLNILTNAEQAIRGQQATGQVTVRTSVVDERIRLSISDDGPGIANEDLDKVFDPFFTTKQIGEGTGLGLSMSYGIIHQHGGDIWVESLPGEGATFHIEIPITGPFAESDSPATEKAIVKAHGSVLVVDDEPRILQLMSRLLTVDGVVVDLAGSGEDAWNMLQLLDYDCILLDLRMPDMSGMELYRAVKTKDVELARKVIFMTGDTVGAETRDFIASCANRTLDKPVDLQEVRSLVNEMLAK